MEEYTMKYRNCTREDLWAALDKVNERYNNNITFNRIDNANFTLKVHDYTGPGHRVHIRYENVFSNDPQECRRRSSYACWHVHGHFFDALFEIAPDAVVYSLNEKITKDKGNWVDRNIGSMMYPVYFSESCDCQ